MNERQAAAQKLEGKRIRLIINEKELWVHQVIEAAPRWITITAQRINQNGTLDARDSKPRQRSLTWDAFEVLG